MMKRMRIHSAVLAVIIAAGALLGGGARPAHADKEDMWRIATYGLAGASAYMGIKGKGTGALLGAAGTYLTYRQWKKEVNERHEGHRRPVRTRRR
jgi:hypothetical protein